MKDIRLCIVEGCNKVVMAKGLCSMHYTRLRRYGAVDIAPPRKGRRLKLESTIELFYQKIEVQENGCWLWTDARTTDGYGRFSTAKQRGDSNTRFAHKYIWEFYYGPVPEGLVLDHYICDTPPCVNPDHCKPVTSSENVLRGKGICALNLRKTHCPKGHEYSDDNTYVTKDGRRRCLTCSDKNGNKRG